MIDMPENLCINLIFIIIKIPSFFCTPSLHLICKVVWKKKTRYRNVKIDMLNCKFYSSPPHSKSLWEMTMRWVFEWEMRICRSTEAQNWRQPKYSWVSYEWYIKKRMANKQTKNNVDVNKNKKKRKRWTKKKKTRGEHRHDVFL